MTESTRQFWIQDNNFYSLLENSKWLQYVSSCLTSALETANKLNDNESVVLQGMYAKMILKLLKILIV